MSSLDDRKQKIRVIALARGLIACAILLSFVCLLASDERSSIVLWQLFHVGLSTPVLKIPPPEKASRVAESIAARARLLRLSVQNSVEENIAPAPLRVPSPQFAVQAAQIDAAAVFPHSRNPYVGRRVGREEVPLMSTHTTNVPINYANQNGRFLLPARWSPSNFRSSVTGANENTPSSRYLIDDDTDPGTDTNGQTLTNGNQQRIAIAQQVHWIMPEGIPRQVEYTRSRETAHAHSPTSPLQPQWTPQPSWHQQPPMQEAMVGHSYTVVQASPLGYPKKSVNMFPIREDEVQSSSNTASQMFPVVTAPDEQNKADAVLVPTVSAHVLPFTDTSLVPLVEPLAGSAKASVTAAPFSVSDLLRAARRQVAQLQLAGDSSRAAVHVTAGALGAVPAAPRVSVGSAWIQPTWPSAPLALPARVQDAVRAADAVDQLSSGVPVGAVRAAIPEAEFRAMQRLSRKAAGGRVTAPAHVTHKSAAAGGQERLRAWHAGTPPPAPHGALAVVRVPSGVPVGGFFSATLPRFGGMLITVPRGAAAGTRLYLYSVPSGGGPRLQWRTAAPSGDSSESPQNGPPLFSGLLQVPAALHAAANRVTTAAGYAHQGSAQGRAAYGSLHESLNPAVGAAPGAGRHEATGGKDGRPAETAGWANVTVMRGVEAHAGPRQASSETTGDSERAPSTASAKAALTHAKAANASVGQEQEKVGTRRKGSGWVEIKDVTVRGSGGRREVVDKELLVRHCSKVTNPSRAA